MAASGALGFDGKGYPWEQPLRFIGFMDQSLFTVVSKTITYHKKTGNLRMHNPLTWGCIHPMKGGSLNSIGLTNPGFRWYLENIARKADSQKIPLVPSIMSGLLTQTPSKWLCLAERWSLKNCKVHGFMIK